MPPPLLGLFASFEVGSSPPKTHMMIDGLGVAAVTRATTVLCYSRYPSPYLYFMATMPIMASSTLLCPMSHVPRRSVPSHVPYILAPTSPSGMDGF